MKKIILASASPRRRELLAQAGIPFEVITSQAEEVITREAPGEVVMELAEKKAEAVADRIYTDAIVIGSDTVVAIDGRILGKPVDEEDAARMLRMLSGREHQVYTGVALLIGEGGSWQKKVFYEETQVEMFPMTEGEICRYIATGEPLDKAGAYGIQGRAAVFVKSIRGDYNTVVGLPVSRLYQELKEWLTTE
ncbi:MAG: Maf family protein [Candidatus Limivivens sp.]|nr:Maf family protein [Candidatus Limivivens sp.]